MKHSAFKSCDLCHKIVAEKRTFRFHTVVDYMTIRMDEVPTWSTEESNTIVRKLHYCEDCWLRITYTAKHSKEDT